MKKDIISDKELSSIFNQDAANHVPDEAIRERMEYAFMVKSRSYKTTQNSFLGLFVWLFSWSNLPLKAAMVSVVLLFSLVNIKNVETPLLQQMQDTTLNTMPFHIDSSQTSPYFADTCFQIKNGFKRTDFSFQNLSLKSEINTNTSDFSLNFRELSHLIVINNCYSRKGENFRKRSIYSSIKLIKVNDKYIV